MPRRALESLGRLVRGKRGDRKLREVAKDIGISAPTLLRIEGGRTPDITTFGKVCAWLRVDPADFIGRPDQSAQEGARLPRTEIAVHMKVDQTPDPTTLKALSEMISLVVEMQAPSNLK